MEEDTLLRQPGRQNSLSPEEQRMVEELREKIAKTETWENYLAEIETSGLTEIPVSWGGRIPKENVVKTLKETWDKLPTLGWSPEEVPHMLRALGITSTADIRKNAVKFFVSKLESLKSE